jgi:hypothetical protein
LKQDNFFIHHNRIHLHILQLVEDNFLIHLSYIQLDIVGAQ